MTRRKLLADGFAVAVGIAVSPLVLAEGPAPSLRGVWRFDIGSREWEPVRMADLRPGNLFDLEDRTEGDVHYRNRCYATGEPSMGKDGVWLIDAVCIGAVEVRTQP